MTKYLVIRSVVIPELTEARLYPETIEKVNRRHPEVQLELPSIMGAAFAAVSDPTHVELSFNGSYVFVDNRSTNRSGNPLRVPVKVVTNTSGRVQSVYFAEGTPQAKVVWRRGES